MHVLRPVLVLMWAAIAGLTLAGCPHQVERMIEETLPPENYEPDYLTTTIPYENVQSEYGGIGTGRPVLTDVQRRTLDSLRSAGVSPEDYPAEIRSLTSPLIKMDIRSVDDSRYPDKVTANAYVFDTAGRFISGLAPPNYSGTDWRKLWHRLIDSCSGDAVDIDDFQVEEVSEENRQPYSIAFILDHSGSMGQRRVLILRRAIGLLLKGISKQDAVSIISFTNGNFVEVPLTESKRKWVTSFKPKDLSTYGGGTALYDAAMAGIDEVARGPESSKRVLVMFTDGEDGNSRAKMKDVHEYARRKDVSLYTIAYGPADQEVLSNLALYTGGRMYRIYKSEEFLSVFIDIYNRLNHYYRISYTPPECAGLHTVRALLDLPDMNIAGLEGSGVYDRSVITPFDDVGRVVFVNVEFDYNEATIRPESLPEILEVAEAMKRYPDMVIEVRGHTDDVGDDDYNMKLSERRATAVAKVLQNEGISRSRLVVTGLGETKPLVPNDSDENRRKNRRTEFVILSR